MQISKLSQRIALNCYIGVIDYAESDFHISEFLIYIFIVDFMYTK